MDNPQSSTGPTKPKRGRPRIYPTPEEKTNTDTARKQAKRQGAASIRRDTVYASFLNPFLSALPPLPIQLSRGNHQESGAGAAWANVLTDIHSLGNPTGVPGLDYMDISEFLPPASPLLLEEIEEQAILDIGITVNAIDFADVADSVSIPNNKSLNLNIPFKETSETSL
ncbi:hypothetical protein BGZ61DRAFT_486083 [Ilyonectria robusta]|uniref:uncharacterized protein n=1 Tax=Ilyonectria robusta TaxID=1079257 RepID=UPI001E8ECD61|nr:uncharacterized protein BGZ61DRAFT_486083 [Ilyonectria robusta]KAH8658899.1 hypothetical protein BGZ61DRAFT_486083 [Ilyonectria robusta]